MNKDIGSSLITIGNPWALGVAGVFVAFIFALFTSPGQAIGMTIGPSCWVGLSGHNLKVEVRGWVPWQACEEVKRQLSTGYDTDAIEFPVMCQYKYHGLRYTVRDQGLLNLYSTAACGVLAKMGAQ